MKYNTAEVAILQPDYLGFIFYDKSLRNFEDVIPELPKTIKKVGVFVDEDLDVVIGKIKKHKLDAVQLHGNESPEYCTKLKRLCRAELDSVSHHEILAFAGMTEIIKVFSIKEKFNFSVLNNYEDVCDYYLFDTKGKLPGGNGYTFNWDVLKHYPSTKPYFLSGGIGLEETGSVLSFLRRQESKYCYAIDINSKFEIEPGRKNIKTLKEFKNNICHVERM